jgi:hypothetical protein
MTIEGFYALSVSANVCREETYDKKKVFKFKIYETITVTMNFITTCTMALAILAQINGRRKNFDEPILLNRQLIALTFISDIILCKTKISL